jgi:hypothetical protein
MRMEAGRLGGSELGRTREYGASRWSTIREYERHDQKKLSKKEVAGSAQRLPLVGTQVVQPNRQKKDRPLTTTAFSWKPRPLGSGWMSQYIRDEDGHRFALVLDDVPDRFLNILILP